MTKFEVYFTNKNSIKFPATCFKYSANNTIEFFDSSGNVKLVTPIATVLYFQKYEG